MSGNSDTTRPDGAARRDSLFAPLQPDDDSSHRHRMAVGILGVSLPWLLLLANALRPYPGMPVWSSWSSISLYYYSSGNAVFCGILVALTVFLVTYRGYANSAKKWDILFGVIAGIAAFIVACFPTTADPDQRRIAVQRVPWVMKGDRWTGHVHLAAAVILFACFIIFSLFLFTRRRETKGLFEFPRKKKDWIYVACGAVMLFFVGWAIVNELTGRAIFWQETWALEAFGISWLVKGRVEHTVGHGFRRMRAVLSRK